MISIFKKIINLLLNLFCDQNSLLNEKGQAEIYDSLKSQSNFYVKNEWIVFCLKYKIDMVKDLMWQLKFRNQKTVGKLFGQILYHELKRKDYFEKIIKKFDPEKIILMPVPIDKKRRGERGFNQSEIILKSFEGYFRDFDKTKIVFDYKTLFKKKASKKQSWKNRKERILSQDNYFELNLKRFEYRDTNIVVIIIDDIVTTGTTLSKIKKLFSKYEKIKVLGIAIAG
jgi:ComF family protein